MRFVRILAAGTLLLSAAIYIGCNASVSNNVTPIYGMGDRAPVNRLIYTAFDTHWMPQLETGVVPRIPKDRFFLVRVSILNGGNSEVVLPTLTIVDEKGQKYQELSEGDGVPEWLGYVRRVKPAETLAGNIVFDAPPQNYKLELTDESQEKKAMIEIPMSFAGDVPLELPGVDLVPPPTQPQKK